MLDEIMREQQRKMKEIMTQIEVITEEVKMPRFFWNIIEGRKLCERV